MAENHVAAGSGGATAQVEEPWRTCQRPVTARNDKGSLIAQGGCILLILPSSFDFSDINSNYSPSSSNAPRLHALVSDSLKCLILMTKPASPALLGMHRAPCEYYRAIYSCSVHARSHRAHLNVVTSIYTSSLLVHRHRPDAHTHERPINPNLGRRPLPLPKPQPLTSPYCRRSAREVGTQGF